MNHLSVIAGLLMVACCFTGCGEVTPPIQTMHGINVGDIVHHKLVDETRMVVLYFSEDGTSAMCQYKDGENYNTNWWITTSLEREGDNSPLVNSPFMSNEVDITSHVFKEGDIVEYKVDPQRKMVVYYFQGQTSVVCGWQNYDGKPVCHEFNSHTLKLVEPTAEIDGNLPLDAQ